MTRPATLSYVCRINQNQTLQVRVVRLTSADFALKLYICASGVHLFSFAAGIRCGPQEIMLELVHHDLLAQIASMYYEREMTQNEIADQLGLSRVKVHRLLRESREKGVVRITIDWPIRRDHVLEDGLRRAYGLVDVRVLKAAHETALPPLRQLGSLGARYMEGLLGGISRMAICVGRSTFEVVNAIRPDVQAGIQIVQAIGSIPHPQDEFDSPMLARQLAQKLGGRVLYLASPLTADTAPAARVIRSQRNIQHTLSMAGAAEVALLGIGNLDPHTSGFVRAGLMTPAEIEGMLADGAVGDLAWRVYARNGTAYPCELNERIIGITLDDLRRIPLTIAVAAGQHKALAIAGALRTGAINVLCTDDSTASAVLSLASAERAC